MKSASANRPVDIRLYTKDGGNKALKVVKGQINFCTDREDVMKQMASVARLSPTDPIYEPQQLFIVDADGVSTELKDDDELAELCNALNMFHNSIKTNSKIVAKVIILSGSDISSSLLINFFMVLSRIQLHVIVHNDIDNTSRPKSAKKTPARKTPIANRLSARNAESTEQDENNNKFANVMISAGKIKIEVTSEIGS